MNISRQRFQSVALPLAGIALALALPAAVIAQEPAEERDRTLVYQLDHISVADAETVLTTLNYNVIPAGDPIKPPSEVKRPLIIKPPAVMVGNQDTTSIVGTEVQKEGANLLPGPPTGMPLERLLIIWDSTDPESLRMLLDLLHDRIDVPARQIRIEAMVLELDRNRLKDLGVVVSGKKDGQSFSYGLSNSEGTPLPFTYSFDRPSTKSVLDLTVAIRALVRDGDAEILSQPSVLVLDGRQARIYVGDETPYTQIKKPEEGAPANQIVSSTAWTSSGIALNLRPRATEDGSEVTMKVETLISAAGKTTKVAGAVLGPAISTREVQTIVRVANNTPFIIGGLISQSRRDQRNGVPFLSKIPGIGALFRNTNKSNDRKEVIVVITPFVIPLDDSAFSFSVAKDTELLDEFDLELFRNVYRIKSNDVFDLSFVRDSDFYQQLKVVQKRFAESYVEKSTAVDCKLDPEREPEEPWPPVPLSDLGALARQMRRAVSEEPCFLQRIMCEREGLKELDDVEPLIQLFEGRVPGEEILVQRMLLELIEDQKFGKHVKPEKIRFFKNTSEVGEPLLELVRLVPELKDLGKQCNTVSLLFEQPTGGFDPPTARVDDSLDAATDDDYLAKLREHNRRGKDGTWDKLAVLFNDCYERRGKTALEMLRSVLVLKRLLEVNPSLPLTLKDFQVGREVIFPEAKSLESASHIVDRRTAELFYETLDYYNAFVEEFTLAYVGLEKLVASEAGITEKKCWQDGACEKCPPAD